MLSKLRMHLGSTSCRVLPLGTSLFGKIFRASINIIRVLILARPADTAYVSIPGQLGAWLLLPLLIALRCRKVEIWFHHHSYRSINLSPTKVMRSIVATAGPNQRHILLSDSMRDEFFASYLTKLRPERQTAYSLSNTFLLPPDTTAKIATRPTRPVTIGHMSILTREKGFFYVIDIFEKLVLHLPSVRLILAGPVSDPEIMRAINGATARHGKNFEYRGKIGGDEKGQFYRDIDFFVLPTTLIDEAEPLVMIEAYSHGVDVFATAMGCIPDRLRDSRRTLSLDLELDSDLIGFAIRNSPDGWRTLRRDCRNFIERMTSENKRQAEKLFAEICGNRPMK